MADEVLEAVGGVPGGADAPTGQRVVVRLDGTALDVFHETGCERFHAAMVDVFEVADHPSHVGTALVVQALRRGINIPVRFEAKERARVEAIIDRVRGSAAQRPL